jgi:uncharacterized cupin superfamily protein
MEMEKIGKNYKVTSIGNIQEIGRVTLHEPLALTGSEISINELPAGASVPFVHAHTRNEEAYIILSGKGMVYIDGDECAVQAGDVLRIDRTVSAASRRTTNARSGLSASRRKRKAWCSLHRTTASPVMPSQAGLSKT